MTAEKGTHKHILVSMDNTLMMSSLMTSIATLLNGVITHPVGDTDAMAGFLDENGSPSLVILDMEMRDNKGIVILEFLASHMMQVPLILINVEGGGIKTEGMNISGQFNKPINYRNLYSMIKNVLER